MSTDARQKMIQSTALLLREQGLGGTSVRDVVEHSKAPRGSVYHHFPGGKTELVEAAVKWAGDLTAATMLQQVEQGDPGSAIRAFVELWRQVLVSSDFRAGCPVVAVATEAQDSERDHLRLAGVASDAFQGWREVLIAGLGERGVPAARASTLATMAIASIEGAVVISRARRDTSSLEDVGAELELLFADALAV